MYIHISRYGLFIRINCVTTMFLSLKNSEVAREVAIIFIVCHATTGTGTRETEKLKRE